MECGTIYYNGYSQSAMGGSLAYWPAAIPQQVCRGCETSVYLVGGSTSLLHAVSESIYISVHTVYRIKATGCGKL